VIEHLTVGQALLALGLAGVGMVLWIVAGELGYRRGERDALQRVRLARAHVRAFDATDGDAARRRAS
jgi:hypothetical protein